MESKTKNFSALSKSKSTSNRELTRADMLHLVTCSLCQGVFRDAHTINECMCSFCKRCILMYFASIGKTNKKCPQCYEQLGGRPTDTLIKDITVQSIADWLFPEFKEREDKLRAQLLEQANEKRKLKVEQLKNDHVMTQVASSQENNHKTSNLHSSSQIQSQPQKPVQQEINFEFKLLPFNDDDQYLKLPELPKKLKFANKNKTILTVKKHIHNYLKEPIDNIEILCKNFPVADSHSLEYIKKTKWQNNTKIMELMYKRKKRVIGGGQENASRSQDFTSFFK